MPTECNEFKSDQNVIYYNVNSHAVSTCVKATCSPG